MILVWPSFIFTLISAKLRVVLTLVFSSSGHRTFKSIFSPTDFPLILKNKNSISNIGIEYGSIFSKVHDEIRLAKELFISLISSDSCASINTFCSLTRKGLYFIVSPVDGCSSSKT